MVIDIYMKGDIWDIKIECCILHAFGKHLFTKAICYPSDWKGFYTNSINRGQEEDMNCFPQKSVLLCLPFKGFTCIFGLYVHAVLSITIYIYSQKRIMHNHVDSIIY